MGGVARVLSPVAALAGSGNKRDPVTAAEPKEPKIADAAAATAQSQAQGRAANTFGGGGSETGVLGDADFSVRKRLLGN